MGNALNTLRIGKYECTVVPDGTFAYPHPDKVLFVDAPQDQLARALAEWDVRLSDWDTYVSPYPSLLIDSGSEKLLVDAGAGKLGPSTGQLVRNLAAIGVSPLDIDSVVLTHAHPDHVGGVLDSNGNPTFSRARHLIAKVEWDYWMNSPDLSRLKLPAEFKEGLIRCATHTLPALGDRLELIDQDSKIAAGIHAFAAEGHTPGQIGLQVNSEEQVLMAVADAIVHPVHVSHPNWSTAVDCAPEIAVQTRRRILNQAAADRAVVFAYHFPAPGLGYVNSIGDGWRWQPFSS